MIRTQKINVFVCIIFALLCALPVMNKAIGRVQVEEPAQQEGYVAGKDMALIRTIAQKIHKFHIETMITTDDQKQGLMGREQLNADAGMLFVFAGDSAAAMWMRNTKISLDMLFIGTDGRIEHIHANATPMSDDLILPPFPVRAVLEINAGLAEKLGIKIGDHLDYPIFKSVK